MKVNLRLPPFIPIGYHRLEDIGAILHIYTFYTKYIAETLDQQWRGQSCKLSQIKSIFLIYMYNHSIIHLG